MDDSMNEQDLYAALLHEMKNNLVLLAMILDSVPHTGNEEHDVRLDEARLLGQRVSERLMQALFLYKGEQSGVILNAIDAYCPEELVDEIARQARSLAKQVEVSVDIAPDVPPFWFYDRNMLEMALINAMHNSINYARNQIDIRAEVRDGMLVISVRDDSEGYPQHILDAVAKGKILHSNGTGLGLRFARLIARAHCSHGKCGMLRLYNDNGAVFEISVP